MSVNHHDIFNTALELQALASTSANSESSLRSAASRAYYAALHASLDALPTQFHPDARRLKEENSNVLIQPAITQWGHSLTPGRTEAQELARHLPKLKKLRKNADYAIAQDFSSDDAKEAVHRAQRVLENVLHAKSKQQHE